MQARDKQARAEALGRLFWAWLFTLPIALIFAASWAFGAPWPSPLLRDFGVLVLAFPVVFVVGGNAVRSAAAALRQRRPDLSAVIVALAVLAYATGVLSLVAPVANLAGVAALLMCARITASCLGFRRDDCRTGRGEAGRPRIGIRD